MNGNKYKIVKSNFLRHLLMLFPSPELRKHFDAKGKGKGDLAGSIVSKNSEPDILRYVVSNHGLTKQHVHLFELSGDFPATAPETILEDETPYHIEIVESKKHYRYFYLLELVVSYVAGTPPEEGKLTFLWPMTVDLFPKRCELYMTIMERSLKPYLPVGDQVFSSKKDIEEPDVLAMLKNGLNALEMEMQPFDLNKGIKSLWSNDYFDAMRVMFTSSLATMTEALHEQYLLKRNDRAKYEEAIQGPILKTVFKTLNQHPFPDIWTCDPTGGHFEFRQYPDSSTQIRKLVEKILQHNR